MSILQEIVKHKKAEVAERISLYPIKLLEQSIYFGGKTVSLKKYVLREDKTGIIAEFKRQSPSKGVINPYAAVERTSIGYMQAGASALSVLTDRKFFGGKNEDLTVARKFNYCPILRKDFVLEEYQIVEAKAIGADAILLIAAILEPARLKELAAFAKTLDLEVLMEVHNLEELQQNLHPEVDLIGVNNRNLNTFVTDIAVSKELAQHIPQDFVKISESGISNPATILELRDHGYNGFLIGESFMQHSRPEQAAARFVHDLELLQQKKKQSKGQSLEGSVSR
ncbi:indole-3-glycerol phosphate synthase TrpC [Cesiribacter sp. SM1]|uniref:indole-3-glycerol phosphate synthase TrpC n=1 Tax=Cesiribacter sp. SM1 TaxID=2861196 RepID=UPI001CD1AF19|nr:indole-3-glycerol phosphate synthase TrpC [Cesiribacter sp. SM1]